MELSLLNKAKRCWYNSNISKTKSFKISQENQLSKICNTIVIKDIKTNYSYNKDSINRHEDKFNIENQKCVYIYILEKYFQFIVNPKLLVL